ncbi:MAG: hypothetical protein EOO22_00640 [Comamonadaceae bacterium]|nr:MAG: hypothetical protein EOO22_00640 [Comamonadaceae bacterium]
MLHRTAIDPVSAIMMTRSEFHHLCMEAARLCGDKAPYAEPDGFSLKVAGIEVVLTFSEENGRSQVRGFFDLGQPEPSDRAALCEYLLEANLRHDDADAGQNGFDAQTGQAIHLRFLDVDDEVDAGMLVNWLRNGIGETQPLREAITLSSNARASLLNLPATSNQPH